MANLQMVDSSKNLLIVSGITSLYISCHSFCGTEEVLVKLTQAQAEQLKQFLIDNF